MEIKILLGIDDYTLLICYRSQPTYQTPREVSEVSSPNLYRLSIIDRESKVHEFEGIYPTLMAAVERGRLVIRTLMSLSSKEPET